MLSTIVAYLTTMVTLPVSVSSSSPSPPPATSDTGKKELKRPDLQGDFYCFSCNKHFTHAPSLNRHRIKDHGMEVECQLCMRFMREGETVKGHLRQEHGILSFTCSCCAWTFKDKKDMSAHNMSMKKTGAPGATIPVAKGRHVPGSLSQKEQQRKRPSSTGQSSSTGTSDTSDGSGSVSPNGSDSNGSEMSINDAYLGVLNSFIATNEEQKDVKGSRKRKNSTPFPLSQHLEPVPEEPVLSSNDQLELMAELISMAHPDEAVVHKRAKLEPLH